MNSTTSGWSALRMTIFAARRVLPPDLMTPANASKPFMNDTGPEAVPPPASSSCEERIAERLEPVPEPYLNSMPSVLARVRIDSIVSCTELMKHAEHCGWGSMPQLNQTGLLKAAFWKTSRCFRSSLKACRSSSLAKYFCVRAQPVMVSTTRPISCRTERSRSGVPMVPRKYLETTMLVACCDHDFGISTSRCSNTTWPFSLPMTAERVSHSTASNGSTPSRVKNLGNSRPGTVTASAAPVDWPRTLSTDCADCIPFLLMPARTLPRVGARRCLCQTHWPESPRAAHTDDDAAPTRQGGACRVRHVLGRNHRPCGRRDPSCG